MSNRHQQSVSSVVAQHSAVKQPTVTVLGYALAGDGMARIVAEISHNRFSRDDHTLVSESLSKMFENRMSTVHGSFRSIDKAPYTERVVGMVRVNTDAIPMSAAKNFRSVSSNIFMDDEEKMWVLRKNESGDILVKNTGIEDHDSLRKLLDVVCHSGHSLSSEFRTAEASISSMQNRVAGGSYVQYVSAHGVDTRFGYVVAATDDDKLIVLPAGDEAPEGEVVDRNAVVSECDTADAPDIKMSEQENMDDAVSVSRGVVGVSTLLDFYKKVYGRSGNYYEELAKRIRGHAFM